MQMHDLDKQKFQKSKVLAVMTMITMVVEVLDGDHDDDNNEDDWYL